MQVKDIPTIPILEHLAYYNDPHEGPCGSYDDCKRGHWCLRFEDENPSRIYNAFPDKAETPESLLLAKMRSLIKKGLVDGCTCGCRGDFEITAAGQQYLGEHLDG